MRQIPDAELESFGRAIDGLRSRLEAAVGAEDLAHVRRLDRLSRGCEIVGRTLIHFSFEPVGFGAGVVALWLRKQLHSGEIGHTVLHGTYDRIPGAEAYHSKRFRWDFPIDEECWRDGHNHRHHAFTNVVGIDPDIYFGHVRFTDEIRHRWFHRGQLAYTLGLIFPNMAVGMNAHHAGLFDLGRPAEERFYNARRSWQRTRRALRGMLRKQVRYTAKEFVLYPALAGPFWWKVALGNLLAETIRNLYTAASIHPGHVAPEAAIYPRGTKAGSRWRWYEMQVRATHNFQVPYVLSVLCGGLDHQIEHHLFPRIAPQRLRQVAPEVRAICEQHGVPYRTGPWREVLGQALGHISHLSRPTARERGRAGTASESLGERSPRPLMRAARRLAGARRALASRVLSRRVLSRRAGARRSGAQ